MACPSRGTPSLWYGVVAGAAPRVAAGYPFCGEPAAFDDAIFANRLDAILRAGGGEAARRGCQGRNTLLVEAY